MNARLSGVLVVDKPEGPTSHDVVQTVRRLLKTKVGHTGTLDPLATGVLPLLLGHATRLMRFYQGDDKEYLAHIRLGRATQTYDREGETTSQAEVPPLSQARCLELLAKFTGEIDQIPPLYSAIKIKGERLYKIARRGGEVEPPARRVTIRSIELVSRESELWVVRVHCSSGTYIRSLAHDIGVQMGCGAHLESLRRLRSGDFDLSRAVSLDDDLAGWQEKLHPLDELLPRFPRLELGEDAARLFVNGNPVQAPQAAVDLTRVFGNDRMLGIGEIRGGSVHPRLVFA